MSTETDDFLAHYGVKGMKWGKRKSGSEGPSRKELRTMDKAERAKDRAEAEKRSQDNDKRIQDAREQVLPKAKAVKQARDQYKLEKRQIGKVAAKKPYLKAQDEFLNTLDVAKQKTRKEATQALLLQVGSQIVLK